ncbi:MAG: hypothetical protein ACRC7P_03275 [Enterovibrio sp.]
MLRLAPSPRPFAVLMRGNMSKNFQAKLAAAFLPFYAHIKGIGRY